MNFIFSELKRTVFQLKLNIGKKIGVSSAVLNKLELGIFCIYIYSCCFMELDLFDPYLILICIF